MHKGKFLCKKHGSVPEIPGTKRIIYTFKIRTTLSSKKVEEQDTSCKLNFCCNSSDDKEPSSGLAVLLHYNILYIVHIRREITVQWSIIL